MTRPGPATRAALVVALAFTGCAGSATTSESAVAPAAYVRNVCRALLEWNAEVGSAFAATDARPDSDRPAAIRKDMLDFFDAIQSTTDSMRSRIEKTGAPDVADGPAAARALRQALADASDKLKSNRAQFAAVPLSDVQPAASIEGAMTVLGEQLDAVNGSVLRLDERSPELARARSGEPECVRLAKLS